MSRAKPPPVPPNSPDEVEAQFYEALQRADLEALMAVWSDDDDIVCVHPGGPRVVGASAIRAGFEAIFSSGGVPVVPEQVRRLQALTCAVHSVLERIEVVGETGRQTAWVVATNVYVKTAQGWRLAAHHASPGTARERPDHVEASATLH